MGRTCDGCGVKMPFGVCRQKDAQGRQVCEGCRSGRPGRPRTQGSIKPGRVVRVAGDLARRTATYDVVTSSYEDVRVGDTVPGRLDWAEVVRIEDGGPVMPTGRMVILYLDDGSLSRGRSGDPIDTIKVGSRRTAAEDPLGGPPPPPSSPPPDRQSDAVVRVCPFCGSGAIVGNADGSIECGHDGIIFTIEVQPRHLGQPLVNPDGTPFDPDFGDGDGYPAIGVAGAEEMADPLADITVPSPGEDPAVPSGGSTPAPGQDPAGLNAMQAAPAPGQDPRTAIRRR